MVWTLARCVASSIFLLQLLQSLFIGVLADQNGRISTFHIQQNVQAEHTVSMTLPSTSEKVYCTFSYDTNKKEAPEGKEEAKAPGIVSAEEVLDKILEDYPPSKGCFEGVNNGWTFKICLGEDVVQSYASPKDPMKFLLGKYAGIDKSDSANVRLLFNGGDVCVPEGARTVHVGFVCGSEMKLLQVAEPSTCRYSITMSAKEVCGHPGFPSAPPENVAISQAGPEESWFLELTQLHDNTVVCTAQHSGMGKMDSSFYFNSFSLRFDTDAVVPAYKARRANRASLTPREVKEIGGGISSDTHFKNTLYYARISKK